MKTKVLPKKKGFICTTSHPIGCQKNVLEQIENAKNGKKINVENSIKNVLIIGGSTGYGLSSRILATYGLGANTLNVCFERKSVKGRTASAGWYNTIAFEDYARKDGFYAETILGDAFSDEIKEYTIQKIKKDLEGKIDLVIYSLASPKRIDPREGKTYSSVLKPIGSKFSDKTLNTDTGVVSSTEIEPANEEEIANTVKVMGGEDWSWWIEKLLEENILSNEAMTVNYSYIGPKATQKVYRTGTIGEAKKDLERTCLAINEKMKNAVDGRAYISVNKAVITQASSAIPIFPLYVSILYKIMKQQGTHEDCFQQIYRLFEIFLSKKPKEIDSLVDENSFIRIDDLEMKKEVQDEVDKIWKEISSDNLKTLSDFENYQKEFLNLYGFCRQDVDYEQEVEIEK